VVAQFLRCRFTDAALGVGISLSVTVHAPATTHSLRMARLEAWLESAGTTPREQALTVRLREELTRAR
jgi:hypothetical protein